VCVLKAMDNTLSTQLNRSTWSYALKVLSEIIRDIWIGISARTICFEIRRVLVGACVRSLPFFVGI